MPPHADDSVFDLLQPERLTHIVDIGANPIEGDPPYKTMLRRRIGRVTGFEPQESALSALNECKGPEDIYLPYVIGNGKDGQLNVCAHSGWTSLLHPRAAALDVFPDFKNNATVVQTMPVKTTRLDDVEEVGDFDLFKIDVQGAELDVFRNGREKMKSVVAIQTEISFIALYENQPSFGEIDHELRSQGFVPNTFIAVKRNPIAPLGWSDIWAEHTSQLLEGDILYVRDFVDPAAMSDEQLKHLALISHHCYATWDVACRCIDVLQQRGALPPRTLDRYLGWVKPAV